MSSEAIEIMKAQLIELRQLNQAQNASLGFGSPPRPDQVWINRTQGSPYMWYRLPNYPKDATKEYIEETTINATLCNIKFAAQAYEGKVSSKVNLCFQYSGKVTWIQTATHSVTFRSIMESLDIMSESDLQKTISMELIPSDNPDKPTVVFARFYDFESGLLYRPETEGKFKEIEWLPIENECISKIRSAHGLPMPTRAELDEQCGQLLEALSLDKKGGKQKLTEIWGRETRQELNDGEYEHFLRRLEYLRDNPPQE